MPWAGGPRPPEGLAGGAAARLCPCPCVPCCCAAGPHLARRVLGPPARVSLSPLPPGSCPGLKESSQKSPLPAPSPSQSSLSSDCRDPCPSRGVLSVALGSGGHGPNRHLPHICGIIPGACMWHPTRGQPPVCEPATESPHPAARDAGHRQLKGSIWQHTG